MNSMKNQSWTQSKSDTASQMNWWCIFYQLCRRANLKQKARIILVSLWSLADNECLFFSFSSSFSFLFDDKLDGEIAICCLQSFRLCCWFTAVPKNRHCPCLGQECPLLLWILNVLQNVKPTATFSELESSIAKNTQLEWIGASHHQTLLFATLSCPLEVPEMIRTFCCHSFC